MWYSISSGIFNCKCFYIIYKRPSIRKYNEYFKMNLNSVLRKHSETKQLSYTNWDLLPPSGRPLINVLLWTTQQIQSNISYLTVIQFNGEYVLRIVNGIRRRLEWGIVHALIVRLVEFPVYISRTVPCLYNPNEIVFF